MPRCHACRGLILGDRESTGARCPHCREPLYQQPRDYRRGPLPEGITNGTRCTVHEGNVALATCQRCGNFMCEFCWTRWRGRSVCVACVERARTTDETTPFEVRAHYRRGVWAVVLGGSAWAITLIATVLLVLASAGTGETNAALIGLSFLLVLPAPLAAVLGLGQAAAAIRTRGDHMILATMGLILSSTHVAFFIGALSFAIWEKG